MSIYKALANMEENNQTGAVCTIIRSEGSTPRHEGSKMLVYSDGTTIGSIGGGELESRVVVEAHQAMMDGKTRLLMYSMTDPQRGDPGICGGQLQIYIEPVRPKATVVVIGAGHVGKAVAHLAHWLGFRVVVNDDREQLCNPESVPDGDEYYPVSISELPQHIIINSSTFLVLTTRGMEVDIEGLPVLLDSPAVYIGVIGSRRRWAATRKKLIEMGIPEEKVARIHSPMGLDLKAEKPEEIALSILAEIVMVHHGGDGKPLGQSGAG
jgi:xanthine dehydrogenase accessory factor